MRRCEPWFLRLVIAGFVGESRVWLVVNRRRQLLLVHRSTIERLTTRSNSADSGNVLSVSLETFVVAAAGAFEPDGVDALGLSDDAIEFEYFR